MITQDLGPRIPIRYAYRGIMQLESKIALALNLKYQP